MEFSLNVSITHSNMLEYGVKLRATDCSRQRP